MRVRLNKWLIIDGSSVEWSYISCSVCDIPDSLDERPENSDVEFSIFFKVLIQFSIHYIKQEYSIHTPESALENC